MKSCWDADPFNRPPFRKVVEQIEQQLSDTAKHVGLTLATPFKFYPLLTVVHCNGVCIVHGYNQL